MNETLSPLLIFDRELIEERTYWLKQLSPQTAIARLRPDAPPSAGSDCSPESVQFELTGDPYHRLIKLTNNGPFLTYATLLACLKICLYKYSGLPRVVVGSPAQAGQPTAASHQTVTNVLALCTEVDSRQSFRNFLVAVAQTLKNAYARQRYPYQRLIRDLGLSHNTPGTDRFPLFDILLRSADIHAPIPSLTPCPDIIGSIVRDPDRLSGHLHFRPEVYQPVTVQRFIQHILNLLQRGLQTPHCPIAELSLLSATEEHEHLVIWNDTAKPFSSSHCMHQLFESQVERQPDAAALTCETSTEDVVQLSYASLNSRANQLAGYLHHHGVGSGVLVGVSLPRSPEMVISILAILKAGGAYVPLDPTYPAQRLSFMLQDARVQVLLSKTELLQTWSEQALPTTVINLDLDPEQQAIAAYPTTSPNSPVRADNLAYIIYTSGSTGQPKGVAIAHRGLCNMLEAQVERFQVTAHSRVIQLASLSFDASISEIGMALCAGAQLFLGTERNLLPGPGLVHFLERYAVSHATIPPSALAVLPADPGPSLHTLIVAGEACPPTLINRWSPGRQLFNAYGPTESTVCTTIAACSEDSRPHSIGRPIANLQVYVLDHDLCPLPCDIPGEIYIGGVGLAQGYLNRPGLTAERFIPNPFQRPGTPQESDRLYKTGDQVRYFAQAADGALAFMGRIDHQVKVRGFRIELEEIEAALTQHPGVQHAVAGVWAAEQTPLSTAQPQEDAHGPTETQRLVAYLIPAAPGNPPSSQALRDFLTDRLPAYMLPSRFVSLTAFPLTPSGKIDRHALQAPDQARPEVHAHYSAPQTETQRVLAEVWAKLLDLEQVGIHNNFFELGGHSLLATQLISHVHQTLAIEYLSVRHVFEHPTVAKLGQYIDDEQDRQNGQDGQQTRTNDSQPLSPPPISPLPRQTTFPLSFAQQRLWFLDQLEGQNSTYNLPMGLRLDGQLDQAALEYCLTELRRRHAILRTIFPFEADVPVQKVTPNQPFGLPVVDLQSLSPQAQEHALNQATAAEARRPFNLATGPLLRGLLFRLHTQAHVLVLTMHHIITDGWSMGIMVEEISTLYRHCSQRLTSPLIDPPLQYADFSAWQREWQTEDHFAAQLNYWTRQLEGAPALLALPTDRPRPAEQTFQGETVLFSLSAELTQALTALSQQAEASLFMTLLAAFQVLLARYAQQDDVVVGTDVANRTQPELESMLGFFVNQLALRTQVAGDKSFREVLHSVREMCLDAYANQNLPFQRLLDHLQLERDLSRTPVFQVKLILQNAPGGALDLPGLRIHELAIASETTTFDLVISITESAERLEGFVTYRTELFDQSTVQRLLGHWQTLLSAVVEQPEQPVASLPLLTQAERHQLVIEWNAAQTSLQFDQCVHHLVEAQAALQPDAVALRWKDIQLSYRLLNDRANQLAAHLQQLGVGPEVLVGICVERCLDMLLGQLAVLKAGGAYLPLDPSVPLDRLAYMLEDAHPPVLLTHTSVEDRLPSVWAQVISLDETDDGAVWAGHKRPVANLNTPVQVENLAYAIYTSGSTGQPKAVTVPHRGLLNLIAWHRRVYAVGATDRATQLAGMAFDASVWEVWPYLASGASVSLVEPELVHDPAALQHWLIHENITMSFVPTPLAEVVLALDWSTLLNQSSLRLLFTGGDKLHFHPDPNLPFPLINNYGPTENTVVTTWTEVPARSGPAAAMPPPIGRPVDNSRVYIVDALAHPVPIGVDGELLIGGTSLARGYLNQPGLTSDKFRPDPLSGTAGERVYTTGDRCRYLADGTIEYVNRLDSQIQLRGFRIELAEIESVLSQQPQVSQAAVSVWQRAPGDEALAAYLVLNEQAHAVPEALRASLKTQLPDYMIPAVFVQLERLPLTPNGKLDRQRLPVPEQAHQPGQLDTESERTLPRTAQEQLLCAIWANVLKREQVGIHDNFFELGGDSILSIQIIARANQNGLHLSPRQMFQHQTIAELAAVADTAHVRHADQGPVTGPISLTPIQQWFFTQAWAKPSHYTQSMVFQTTPEIRPDLLEGAFRYLLVHHDALRLRFSQTSTGWQQTSTAPAAATAQLPFACLDLSLLSIAQQAQCFTDCAALLQASLDISVGPLTRLVYFRYGQAQPGRLLFIIHHLAVDTVSWQILIEDLTAVYTQLVQREAVEADKAVRLPNKTSSFRDWAHRLHTFCQSDAGAEAWDFWASALPPDLPPLPGEAAAPPQANTNAAAQTLSVSLSVEDTRSLLHEVLRASQAQINDILLTALLETETLTEWTGEPELLLDLEGHGREQLGDDLFEDVDVSRTVGWFTAVFPVYLRCSPQASLTERLQAVKEQLSYTRRYGVSYGVLRYLHPDPAVRDQLRRQPQPLISFNYLGQLDPVATPAAPDGSTGPFRPASEPHGPNHDPSAVRPYILEIGGLVAAQQLHVDWRYSPHHYTQADIQRLAATFLIALQEIIHHYQSAPRPTPTYTPADFPLAGLDQAHLDQLLAHEPMGWGDLEDIYPLSPMQQGMLYHSLYDPDSHLYFEQVDILLEGRLEPTAFAQAWQYIVDRHTVWRTRFAWVGLEEPLQIVYTQVRLPWLTEDWRGQSAAQQARRLTDFLARDRAQGLRLDEAPLMRGALLRISDDRYHFIWTHHHAMIDGWCLPLLLAEAFALHDSLRDGQAVQLAPPRPYRDFIAWLADQDRAQAEHFWREKLRGFAEPTVVRLGPNPQLIQRLSDQTVSFPRAEHLLTAQLTEQLHTFAKDQRITLNTLVQAAWAILLSRYSGRTDIVYGATRSGRPPALPGVETMVGVFLNTVPVRLTVAGDTHLIPWLQQILAEQFERDPHSYVSLSDIQTWSEVPRGTPLFESFVVFENYPAEAALQAGGSLQIRGLSAVEQTGYPLTLIAGGGHELSLDLLYDSRRFGAHTIARLLTHLEVILTGFVTRPSARVGDISLLTQHEQQQLLSWNATNIDYQRDSAIHQLFEGYAAHSPDAIALVSDAGQLTYAALNQQANRLAHYLGRLGVEPEIPVAVCMDRSLELVVAVLAVLKAGGAFVPLDPSSPAQRLRFMLEDSRAAIVLLHRAYHDQLSAFSGRRLYLDPYLDPLGNSAEQAADPWQKESPQNPNVGTHPESLAYLMYTSGSTGLPKGSAVTHRNVVRIAKTPNYTSFSPEDVFMLLAPVSFDASTLELWAPLLNGGRSAVFPATTPSLNELGRFIEHHQLTTVWLPAGLFSQMVEHQLSSLRHLRVLLAGGDVLPAQHVRSALHNNPHLRLVNGYGPTENTVFTCCYPMTSQQLDLLEYDVPIGPPIHNTQVYVLDEQQHIVPVGVAGELYAGGDGVSRGYYRRPALTAERFVPDACSGHAGSRLYRSGDLVRWQDDGVVHFLGRVDWQIKIRGFRVEPDEIEAVLDQHPAVHAAVILPREDTVGTKQLIAYIVPRAPAADHSAEALAAELGQYLQARLPSYMLPAAFEFMEVLPLTSNGKIDRRGLLQSDGWRMNGARPVHPPRDVLELQLRHIWEDVLDSRPIGVHDNFFAVGGHSMLAIGLIAHIEQQLGKPLPVATVLERPTIALQAELLRPTIDPTQTTPLVTIQACGQHRPLFCIHPGGGTAFCYLPLASYLGPEQPFYGLQSLGLSGEQEPLTRIEDMAAVYLEAIQKVQPHGPYQLAGWSMGGIVAYEMAQQLTRQGQRVEVLVLIDTYSPHQTEIPENVDDTTLLQGLVEEVAAQGGLQPLSANTQQSKEQNEQSENGAVAPQTVPLLEQAKALGLLPTDAGHHHLERLIAVFKANLRAVLAYQPCPYAGPVTIFRAEGDSADTSLGWAAFVRGKLDTQALPGDHFAVVREPYIQTLAERLQRCLRQGDDSSAALATGQPM